MAKAGTERCFPCRRGTPRPCARSEGGRPPLRQSRKFHVNHGRPDQEPATADPSEDRMRRIATRKLGPGTPLCLRDPAHRRFHHAFLALPSVSVHAGDTGVFRTLPRMAWFSASSPAFFGRR